MEKSGTGVKLLDNMALKSLLNDYLKTEANYDDEYVKVANAALKRAAFEGIVVFNHNEHLVMINTNSSISKIKSGIVVGEDGKIEKFKTSDDFRSVTTNAMARSLIIENVTNETDIVRLRALTKDKRSWVIHVHTNKENEKFNVPKELWFPRFIGNMHTHGLSAYNHRDFQVILDIGAESAAYVLNKLAERVRNGEVFTDGELVSDVYPDCNIKLAIANEVYREVFRIMIPDEKGRFPGDEGCDFPYSEQDRIIE